VFDQNTYLLHNPIFVSLEIIQWGVDCCTMIRTETIVGLRNWLEYTISKDAIFHVLSFKIK
jgi:hypothetical protein